MNAGRTLSTVGIWTAVTVLGGQLIASTRETVMEVISSVPVEGGDGQSIMVPHYRPVGEAMPDMWLITVGVLLLALLVVAALATLAVWRGRRDERGGLTVGAAVAKRAQQARLRRLVEQMDEHEAAAALASLENLRADDAPSLSVGDLLQRRS